MKVETYEVFNPEAKVEINPVQSIKMAFFRTDQNLRHIGEIKPEIMDDYLAALKKRLAEELADFTIDVSAFDLDEMTGDLRALKDQPDLVELVLRYVSVQLDLPGDYQPGPEKIEVTSLTRFKSFTRLSYHRIKACADVLGDEQGIQLWKAAILRRVEEERVKVVKDKQERLEKGEEEQPLTEVREGAINNWTRIGLADFTAAFLDDHKVLYRFDRCLVPESLKDFEDPDFAYLCSCFYGDSQGYNQEKTIHMRRTQTLHHGAFCDEFYWDSRVYDNPEQPSLEFTQNLGVD